MRGGDLWGIGNWFKKAGNTVYNKVLKPAHSYIKEHKLISRGLGLIPHPAGKALGTAAGLAGYGRRRRRVRRRKVRRHGGSRYPLLNALWKGAVGANKIARKAGFGRRRRRVVRRRRRGGAIGTFLKKAHTFIKQRRLVSGALKHFGHVKLASSAHKLGYGRRRVRRVRRRRVYRRRRRGGAIGTFLKKAHTFIKQRRLVSSALKHFGHTKLASSAHSLGYGRRRRYRRRRVYRRRTYRRRR
jgi:hypothetical protein